MSKSYASDDVEDLTDLDATSIRQEKTCKDKSLPPWGCGRLKSGAQPKETTTLQVTDDNIKVTTSTPSAKTGKVTFLVSAREPVNVPGPQAIVPKINANLVVNFTVLKQNKLSVSVAGNHDGFPSYELYVWGELVYKYDSLTNRDGPYNLFPPSEIKVDVTRIVNGP